MRNVSHLPPAKIISALTKAAPALVSLVPLHSTVAIPPPPCLLVLHQRQGLPAGRHIVRDQGGRQRLERHALGAVCHGRRQVFVAEVGDKRGEVAAEGHVDHSQARVWWDKGQEWWTSSTYARYWRDTPTRRKKCQSDVGARRLV